MPKSRQDKSRKEKVIKYKKSKKMSEKFPESKPFRQVPTWESNDTFELQGAELEALYNFINIFAPAFTSIQQIFSRGVQSGKIKIGYEYEDGKPVPADEVAAYTQKINEYFKKKAAEEQEKAAKEDSGAKIVSFTGEPLKSEE